MKPTTQLIFNPNAGKKRKLFSFGTSASLEDIKTLLKQYQISVKLSPTKGPGHATAIAQNSINEGYTTVLVAGGDGTVGEAANGLVGTDVTLGILPLGSFMNIAKMLSIPADMEKAVSVIKIGRTRKIDVGCITKLDGEKLLAPHYFLETAGIGLEAEIQQYFLEMEQGKLSSGIDVIKSVSSISSNKMKLIMDDQEVEIEATLVTIANAPITGAALHLAPKARLNDHRLTITVYNMSKMDLAKYFVKMKTTGKTDLRKLTTYQTKKLKIVGDENMLIHADARVFGSPPAEFKIIPNALQVITGFPSEDDKQTMVKKTVLDP
ncbi:MAG TPA: diacylglycerol kinase family protein [Candidatus Nitrosocosmicus sp.]|nr:diacylglycerol kinase family protein [Candidatus Nitrosocosmicus sp.]